MKTFTTLLLMLLTIVATAQKNPVTTIYFKDGTTLKGRIIENNPGGELKVETKDKSIWLYKDADIVKMKVTRKELRKQNRPKPDTIKTTLVYTLSKGIFTQLQAEIMPSKKQSSEGTIPSMLGVAGYQLNKHFSVGLGTGVEAYQVSLLPIFGDFRYYFHNDRFTPFINIKAGYAFPLENSKDQTYNVEMKSKGGLMGGVELGYVRSLSDETKFTFSIGYRYQHLVQTSVISQFINTGDITGGNYFNVDRKISSELNRIVVSIGIRFW
jgi:hypothetical protein